MKLFGFEIKREKEDSNEVKSFSIPLNDDGAVTVGTALGSSYASIFNMDSNLKTESDLVTHYRGMSLQPEVRFAIDNIVNEAICIDTEEDIVKLILDDVEVGEKTKTKIHEEFKNVLKLLNFSNNAYEIFLKWYVDGRLNYEVVIDEKNFKRGIVELNYLDPRKIRFVREMLEIPENESGSNLTLKKIKNEYFLYSETGFGGMTSSTPGANPNQSFVSYSNNSANDTYRIAKDSIVRITSGLLSEDNSMVLSYLHSSIKPLNLLRSLEDANIIYTITRAPEKRIFYIDVGDLPTAKAEQYVYSMMVKHKNKVTYDNTTGVISDSRRFMTMTEDFWFPRREGSRSTEIGTIPSAGSLLDNDQLEYFKTNLHKSLNIPVSRFDSENSFSLGRVTEMSREEVMFGKFIRRLRSRFSTLFDKLLEKQLVLKGVITPEEWSFLQENIRYDFMKDNYFEELKSMEILREKIALFQTVEEMIGKHISTKWAYKNIMFMSEEDMEEMRKEIEEERDKGYYDNFDQFNNFDDNMEGDYEEDDDVEEENPEIVKKPIINKKSKPKFVKKEENDG